MEKKNKKKTSKKEKNVCTDKNNGKGSPLLYAALKGTGVGLGITCIIFAGMRAFAYIYRHKRLVYRNSVDCMYCAVGLGFGSHNVEGTWQKRTFDRCGCRNNIRSGTSGCQRNCRGRPAFTWLRHMPYCSRRRPEG